MSENVVSMSEYLQSAEQATDLAYNPVANNLAQADPTPSLYAIPETPVKPLEEDLDDLLNKPAEVLKFNAKYTLVVEDLRRSAIERTQTSAIEVPLAA